jgi:GMP synthase-like glutamine amidotransferase
MGSDPGRSEPGEVLVLRHVDWEGPHRIADALPADARIVDVLRGAPLPDPAGVAGAVVMGGPMGVGDTARHPDLDRERRWLEGAIEHDVPLLGVCLGSQLIASALGAAVRPGRAEIGFEPVTVTSPGDPLVGGLAPGAVVLHWHRDEFELPPGAERLAHSGKTECQAFRHASAWGLLFHPEADARLVDQWLAVAEMRGDAERELGPDAAAVLRAGASRHERDLIGRSTPGFEAFARMVEDRRRALRSEHA